VVIRDLAGMDKQLLQAAEKGHAYSQFNLSVLYKNGLDDNYYAVERNRLEAARWLLAAAEQGLPRAQIKLAEMDAGGPELRNGLRVVPPGDDELARHTSPQGSTNTLHKGKRVNSGSSVRSPFDNAIPRRASIFGLAAMGHARNSARDRDRSRSPCHRVRRLQWQ